MGDITVHETQGNKGHRCNITTDTVETIHDIVRVQ